MNRFRLRLKERRRDRSDVPIDAMRKQLQHIASQGGLKAALLTTEDGFTVVDTESEKDSTALAALAGFAWNMAERARELTGFGDMDQITVSGPSGNSVVCRAFQVDGQMVVLVVIAEGAPPLRELTDRAVEGIGRILSG